MATRFCVPRPTASPPAARSATYGLPWADPSGKTQRAGRQRPLVRALGWASVCGPAAVYVTYPRVSQRRSGSATDFCSFYGVACFAGAITSLNLRSNNLFGPMPTIASESFASLTTLLVGLNNVTGSIPESVYSLTQLSLLDFSQNPLSGTISNAIGDLCVRRTAGSRLQFSLTLVVQHRTHDFVAWRPPVTGRIKFVWHNSCGNWVVHKPPIPVRTPRRTPGHKPGFDWSHAVTLLLTNSPARYRTRFVD